jgi:hypothetical protein
MHLSILSTLPFLVCGSFISSYLPACVLRQSPSTICQTTSSIPPPPPSTQPYLVSYILSHIHVYIPFQAASIHVCRASIQSPSNVGARRTVDPTISHSHFHSIAPSLPTALPQPHTSTPPCCQNDWNIILSVDSDAVFLISPSPCAYTLVLLYVRLLHGRLRSCHFQIHSGRFPLSSTLCISPFTVCVYCYTHLRKRTNESPDSVR